MILFEASWEVCNKVGGIYTHLVSKAPYVVREFKKYFLIGPYGEYTSEFIPKNNEKPTWLSKIEKYLKNKGIQVYYGSWAVEGSPNVILIDFYDFMSKEKNYWKTKFWEWYKIDSLFSSYDFDEPLLWSISVGLLIEKFLQDISEDRVILHAHEWLAGGSILYLKKTLTNAANLKTIFTTHGTVLGRSISASGKDLFSVLDSINPDIEAYNYGVYFKHQLEKAVSNVADTFIVVSDRLALESQKILGRRPDYVIPNGIHRVVSDPVRAYERARRDLLNFISWYFLPYYDIDFENILLGYTIGRPEFFNKGYDLSLSLLRKLNTNKNIIFFIFVPSSGIINQRIARNKAVYESIREKLEEYLSNTYSLMRLLYNGNNSTLDDMKSIVYFSNRIGNPPISTHEVHDFISDKIHSLGFQNAREDPIKVVYVPIYLSKVDGMFNKDPLELLPGFDFAIFLSRYEPFGYTPLEALSYGVFTIISNRSGFASILSKRNVSSKAFYIADIDDLDPARRHLEYFLSLSKEQRIDVKFEAIRVAERFKWDKLFNELKRAYLSQ